VRLTKMHSVDAETDAVMETLIRNEFQNRTVIAVSHKLESMLDYDKVVLLDQGKLVEFDTPDNLLSRDSAFKRLYTNSRDESD
jgi:ABC-type multidrug transport system fused ATPase/permease subunit